MSAIVSSKKIARKRKGVDLSSLIVARTNATGLHLFTLLAAKRQVGSFASNKYVLSLCEIQSL